MAQSTGGEKGFSFDDIFVHVGIILSQTRLVVLSGCLVITCGLIYYCYARPVYEAKSQVKCVYVADPVDKQRVFKERPGWLALRENLPSERIGGLAAKRLGIDMGFRSIKKHFIRRVHIYKERSAENLNDDLVRVEVLGYAPDVVEKWGEALLEEFKVDRLNKRDAKAEVEISKGESELKVAAGNIARLKQEKIELEERLNYNRLEEEMRTLRNLPRVINENRERLELMEGILGQLRKDEMNVLQRFSLLSSYEDSALKMGQMVQMQPLPGANSQSGTSHPAPLVVVTPDNVKKDQKVWIDIYQTANALRKEYNEKRRIFLPGHPSMQQLQNRLEKAERELNQYYESAYASFLLSHSNADNEGQRLRDQMPRFKEVTRNFGEAKRSMDHIENQIKDYQRRHDKLRDKVEQIRLSHSIDPFLEISYQGLVGVSDGSIVPNKGKLLIYCMGGALLLGIGLAYLMEYMDSSVKTPENVETELQIHGLGLVPELPSNIDGDSLDVHQEFPMFKESFRVIRTNLILRQDDHEQSQVIMISSSMPQEGKSLTSLELARSFAELGERTLLLDADLRRGKQTRKIVGKKESGLSDFLDGNAQIEPMQFEDNLDFLPSGRFSAQAIESLGGQAFNALMMGFRLQYDRIIVDGPPLLGLPDVFMMKEALDGMVVIVSAGHTVFPQIRLAVNQIKNSRIPIFGFILNRVSFRTGGRYYRYYYRNYEYYQQARATEGFLPKQTS
jgi:succinoglycan biosynthesis transport protein ExoP